ncbi:unnamed protein product [Lactuca saligna]|uniref:Uncharacterized protein n=1 Tax=Lactuca saligna TaxID=75948 RepID=A0AA35ZLN0_LACSI|nr:unnamed protein product [Lactuca saligna]
MIETNTRTRFDRLFKSSKAVTTRLINGDILSSSSLVVLPHMCLALSSVIDAQHNPLALMNGENRHCLRPSGPNYRIQKRRIYHRKFEQPVHASNMLLAIDREEAYESAMVNKFGDDTSCHPLLDNETWCDVSGGVKKGRIYGFGSVSDPESFLEGTSSTITSQEVVYERVGNEMRGKWMLKLPK